MLNNFKIISIHLFQYLSTIFIFLYFFSKTKVFKNTMLKVQTTIKQKIFLILIFGVISILGTYSGFPVNNAIANTRAIGIIASGLIAGPIVGTGVGVISGIHRYSLGGLTINAAIISTIVQGYLSGLFHNRINYKKSILFESFVIGALLELIHMVIIIAITKPLVDAINTVKLIGPPMIIINSIGVLVTIAILETVYDEQEKTQGKAAELALEIANKTLPYLKKGLNNNSAMKASEIIYNMAGNFDVVCFTSKEKILSYIGEEPSSYLKIDDCIHSDNIIKCLETGEIISFSKKEMSQKKINDNLCRIIIPLKIDKNIIGTIVLSKHSENNLTLFEIKLAKGLAQLISTQLEISKVQYQSHLVAQAEIKALQAQINPHFLFNALNTISYYCITKPNIAKDLIIYLGDFYRKNIVNLNKMVDIETEIQHVKSYLKIEMARFEGKINIEYRIQNDCKCLIPPLILQPIVENAIKHGILPKSSGGTIIISCYKKNGFIVLSVEDNGVGMCDEKIKEIFSNNKKIENIGLRNVKSRLKNIYGEDCKFIIKSKVENGTKITISISIVKGVDKFESINSG